MMRRIIRSQIGSHGLVRSLACACLMGVLVVSHVGTAPATEKKTPPTVKAQKGDEKHSLPGHWRATGNMATARTHHTATLLPNGKVLVVGGESSDSKTTAELFDLMANGGKGAWADAGQLNHPRRRHTATLLPSGKVLVIGGGVDARKTQDGKALTQVEFFDPAANEGKVTWTMAAPLQVGRWGHTATLLPTGKVLVAGGYGGDYTAGHVIDAIELYDPAANHGQGASQIIGEFNPEHIPRDSLYFPTATLLPNGTILFVGNDGYGWSGTCNHQAQLVIVSADERTVQIDYASDEFTLCTVTTTLLSNGRELLVGYSNPHLYAEGAS